VNPVLTIGHSTHPIEVFLEMLRAHEVQQVADVRAIPMSRRHPHFNRERFSATLTVAGFAYVHMPALGGWRKPRPDSINTAWKNASFRGYADYMQTPEFAAAIEALMATANEHRTAIMCAESVPWRCHRSLIADALTARGIAVEHIFNATSRKPHVYTAIARIEGASVTYPGLV
jgi:uncharacterized protein (DUF488 family)